MKMNYQLSLIKNPAGTFSFVGSVPVALAFMNADGSEVSESIVSKLVRSCSPALVKKKYGVKTPTFKTVAEALAFAESRGISADQIDVVGSEYQDRRQ